MSDFKKVIDPESEWGELYLPLKPKTLTGGLRVVLFVSCNCGDNVLKNLFRYEQKYPGKLDVVAVATDNPVDPAAKISKKKRIWSQYTPQEQTALLDKIIATSMDIGIPCYTGAVKTDYFRNLYQAWDPEALIMFCYGQKLDAFLYEYPAMGAYNLHPSDLPKKIGMGTQPFQNALQNGLTTSPLVIHLISELIDMGPIIGVSTPVNIRLADGSAPASILTLLEKITSLGGWMTVELVDALIRRKAAGESGPAGCIDFKGALPESLRCQLMQPATNDLTEMYEVPPHPLLEA